MLLRLFADRDDLRVFALHFGRRQLEYIGVVAARQPAVARDDDEQAVPDLSAARIDRFAAPRGGSQAGNGTVPVSYTHLG